MKKIFNFGEDAAGFSEPVLNEREIRAAAGILFVATYTSFMLIILAENYIPFKLVIAFFLLDLVIRVFVNPKFSPSLILGRLIVGDQSPEYVGAAPKKFAWIVGIILTGIMFVFFNILNIISPVSAIICLICMVFLFFESAFGICIGCKLYPFFYKKKPQYCPGEICAVMVKQDIQKVSISQFIVLITFAVIIVLAVTELNGVLSKRPSNLPESTILNDKN